MVIFFTKYANDKFKVLNKHKFSVTREAVKEVIQKHNKEIGWTFSEKSDRDTNGDKLATLELNSEGESADELNEKMDYFVGLIEDIYNSVGSYIDEETALTRRLERQPDYDLAYHRKHAIPAQREHVAPLKVYAHGIIDGSKTVKKFRIRH